ncbi:unnamed protein product [Arctia plantaginis]|uniref:Uncharacterized protein n=1 Tax=Arctia plantaginis TaxID=874455 RepID=A0A8S0Z1W0_ARCPL|nr:unnamed protein product [Arctia plantaginis]
MDNIGFVFDENLPVVRDAKLHNDECCVAVYRSGSGFPSQAPSCSSICGTVVPLYRLTPYQRKRHGHANLVDFVVHEDWLSSTPYLNPLATYAPTPFEIWSLSKHLWLKLRQK